MVTIQIVYLVPDDDAPVSTLFTPEEEYGPRFMAIDMARTHLGFGVAPPPAPPALGGVVDPYRRRGRR